MCARDQSSTPVSRDGSGATPQRRGAAAGALAARRIGRRRLLAMISGSAVTAFVQDRAPDAAEAEPRGAGEPAAPGTASTPATPAAPDAVVGSAEVLQRLWRTDELAHHPGEEAIRRLRPADRAPPDRPAPRNPLPPLSPPLQNSIRRVTLPAGEAAVALTFDLCEQAFDITGYDGAIVDLLRAAGVPATFYAGG
jgi:hypothetical protein